jgi:hypothetical protein
MHEQRRFAIALVGIGGCLGIAAGIVVTGLSDVAPVPVPRVPTARAAQTLPSLPMPSWSDVASDVTTARMASKGRVATSGSSVAMTAMPTALAPVHLPLDPFGKLRVDGEPGRTVEELGSPRVDRGVQASIVNRQFMSAPLMLSNAPRATGSLFADDRARQRDPVTGAFVTAGSHVGKSFRTVGRTLKRVF